VAPTPSHDTLAPLLLQQQFHLASNNGKVPHVIHLSALQQLEFPDPEQMPHEMRSMSSVAAPKLIGTVRGARSWIFPQRGHLDVCGSDNIASTRNDPLDRPHLQSIAIAVLSGHSRLSFSALTITHDVSGMQLQWWQISGHLSLVTRWYNSS
jgi:hypothetical protein